MQSREGQKNTPVIPTSHPGTTYFCGLGQNTPQHFYKSFHSTTLPNYIPKRHQLACKQACLAVHTAHTLRSCSVPYECSCPYLRPYPLVAHNQLEVSFSFPVSHESHLPLSDPVLSLTMSFFQSLVKHNEVEVSNSTNKFIFIPRITPVLYIHLCKKNRYNTY